MRTSLLTQAQRKPLSTAPVVLLAQRLMLALVLALMLGVPNIAFADDVEHGTIVFTEDVWTLINPSNPANVESVVEASSSVGESDSSSVTYVSATPEQTASSASSTGSSSTNTAADATHTSAAVPSNSNGGTQTGSSTELASSASNQNARYSDTSVVVSVEPGTSREDLDEIISHAQKSGLALSADLVQQSDLDFGIFSLDICDGTSVDDAITIISQVKGIIAASRNYVYSLVDYADGTTFVDVTASVSSDTASSQLNAASSSLSDTSATHSFTQVVDRLTREYWYSDAINLSQAWDLAKVQGSVAVAVIDTGVYTAHEDLQGRIVATYNAVDKSTNAEDEIGHGTHVTGIIAGTIGNDRGIAGASYNANIVAIKASARGKNTFDTSAIVGAYAWLLSPHDASGMTNAQYYNVRVVNLSVGGTDDTYASANLDDQIVAAMLRARAAGILTVAAAGNKTSSEDAYFTYPGDADACLSVMNLKKIGWVSPEDAPADSGSGADDSGGEIVNTTKLAYSASQDVSDLYELASSSNYNVPGAKTKDICAPGTIIASTWRGDAANPGGLYIEQSGTSMATPLVAGVAALMFAVNPSLTPLDVMRYIEASCTDLGDEGWDEHYGYGMLNASAAVALAVGLEMAGPEVLGTGIESSPYWIDGRSDIEGTGLCFAGSAESGWSWEAAAVDADYAGTVSISNTGKVTATAEGWIAIRAHRALESGAEIGVVRYVRVVDAAVSGSDSLTVGESSSFVVRLVPDEADVTEAGSTESGSTESDVARDSLDNYIWAWIIDEGINLAEVDSNGVVTAKAAGMVTVRAVSALDSKLSYAKQITLLAA